MTAEGDPSEPDQPPDPLIGRLIGGKFQIERALGAGAMGRVYRAEQTNLGKAVALKVLHTHMTGDKAVAKRFHREAKSASLLSHPNILQMIDFGDDGGLLYIAMELLSGRDLGKLLRAEWPLPPERIGRIVGQILGALDEAHEKGVVHRDLKPENVMLIDVRGETDFVKVCDFGIAKIASEREGEGTALTMAGMVCGTPEYMSPEQARGEPIDGRTDLYAAAIILYQMVAGELPFRAETALGVVTKQLVEEPIPPSQKRPGVRVAPALEALILRGMAKERDRRFSTAQEMREALFAAVGLRPASAQLPAQPPSGLSVDGSTRAASDPAFAHAATGVAIPASGVTPAGPTQPSSGSVHGEMAAARMPAPGRRGVLWGATLAGLLLAGGGYVLFGTRPDPARAIAPVPAAAPKSAPSLPPTQAAPAIAPAPSAPAPTPTESPRPMPTPAPANPTQAQAAELPSTHDAHPHRKEPKVRTSSAPTAVEPTAAAPSPAPTAHGFAALFAEGETLFKSGSIEAALAKYQEAARLNEKDGKSQRQIGKCYNRLGQRDRAQPYLRRYLELEPNAPDATFIRATLDP